MKEKLLTDERSSHKKQQTFSAEFYLTYTQPLVLAALLSCLLLYLQLYLLIRCGQKKKDHLKQGNKYILFSILESFLPSIPSCPAALPALCQKQPIWVNESLQRC